MLELLWMPAAALGSLFLAVWPWTSLYDRRPTVRLLAALVATSALEVTLQICLASFGMLAPFTLLALTAFASMGSIAVWTVGFRHRHGWHCELSPPTPLGALLGLSTAGVYAGLVAVGSLVPPYGWDTLVYHLTDVFHIAQTGGLDPFPYPKSQFHFPLVGELHSTWFFLLSGAGELSWRVTGVALIPLSLTAGVAVRAAAEALDLQGGRSWILPATLVTPLLLIQPLAGYVDGVLAAFVLASFAFAVLAAAEKRSDHLALLALSAGLALGTKLTFLYMSLPIALVLISPGLWRAFISRRTLLRAVVLIGLFGLGSGFWLVRNVVRHGNPFYPIELRLGSLTLFEGPAVIEPATSDRERFVDSAAGWLGYPFGESYRGRLQYSVDNGFGPLFAAGFAVSPFVLLIAIRRRRWLLARSLAALPLTLLIWFVLSPWEHPRYALPAVGFALLSLAAACATLPRSPLLLARTAIAVATLFSGVVGLANLAPRLPEVLRAWKDGAWAPVDYYTLRYGLAGEAFNWLASEPAPGSTISFNRGVFVAPHFGWHGKNSVVYAATAGDLRIGDAPYVSTRDEWRRALEADRVDWFVVWKRWWLEEPVLSRPEHWLRADAEAFALTADFPAHAQVYRRTLASSLARLSSPEADRDLSELSAAEGWVVEFRQGTEGQPVADPNGGLRVDYRFATDKNDYLDLRFDLVDAGWPSRGDLIFTVEANGAAALLFVYLKEADPRRACRYRVELNPQASPHLVRLDLDAPEWRARGFDPRRIAELHLVLDDKSDEESHGGSIRVTDFRLLQEEETT